MTLLRRTAVFGVLSAYYIATIFAAFQLGKTNGMCAVARSLTQQYHVEEIEQCAGR